MKIEVRFTPSMVVSAVELRRRTVVVIDTLRATSTIVAALMAGARQIIPVEEPEDAVAVAHRIGSEQTLLCGERGSLKIDGFHLGNSPLEYTPGVVGGKTLVLTTTNGTAAMLKAQHASAVFCAAFVNASAVARHLISLEADAVTILCAGTAGRFSIEDSLAAGALVDEITQRASNVGLDDASRASASMFAGARGNLIAALSEGDHGRVLVSAGMEQDIHFCAQLNLDDAPVPFLDGSTIRIAAGRSSGGVGPRFDLLTRERHG